MIIVKGLSYEKILFFCLIILSVTLFIAIVFIQEQFVPAKIESANTVYESLPCEELYDKVLASGDGYYIVSKWIENYQEAYTEYGIIDKNSNWSVPLSKDNEIASSTEGFTPMAESYYDLKFDYIGEGMFVVRRQCCIFPEAIDYYNYASSYMANGGCYIINAVTGHCYEAGAFITPYVNGYCFYLQTRWGLIIRIDKDGNKIEFTKEGVIPFGVPAQGLIFINDKFYDIETAEVKIDLSDYNVTERGNRQFDETGHYTFKFKNPAGTNYIAEINTNGEFTSGPNKLGY